MEANRERQRIGGRSEQVRLAVGAAVLAILSEGTIDLTTVEVAERAGVSRRTVYRWWPSHADLLAEALYQHVRTVGVPDTGSWSTDLRTFAHRVAAFAAAPVDLALTRIIATGRHRDLTDAIFAHYEPVLVGWRQMFERAVGRGEATGAQSAETVLNTLLAPIFLAPLMTGMAPTPTAIDQLVDLILAATLPVSGTIAERPRGSVRD